MHGEGWRVGADPYTNDDMRGSGNKTGRRGGRLVGGWIDEVSWQGERERERERERESNQQGDIR